jgi:PAS domain S-box-containing protein
VNPDPDSLRALILTPTGRDARVAAAILATARLPAYICADVPELRRQIAAGAGMALVAEEELLKHEIQTLFQWVAEQPSWSDFPFIVLTLRSAPATDPVAEALVNGLGNVSFVERPFHANSLISLIRSANRGRLRQYEARARIQELHDGSDRLAHETRMLERLNHTASEIASGLDLETIVQRVVDAGVELTGAAFGAFFYNTADRNGEAYLLYTVSGVPKDSFAQFPLPRITAVFAPTFGGQGIVRSDDITKDPRYGRAAPHHGMPKGHLGVTSYLAVPVISRAGDVIGGLFFGHPRAGVFDERSERLASGLAAQAATAMDNAHLFRAAQNANATLEVRVEERTRERDRMWRLSHDLMQVSDATGKLHAVNRAWTTLLGWPEDKLLAMNMIDLVHPDDAAAARDEVRRLKRGEPMANFECRMRSRDGGFRTISWTSSPEEGLFYSVGRDVTAQQEMEAQLRQSQKMEAVGQLTGGIAHDFNNLLQGITGSLDLVSKRMSQGRNSDVSRFISSAMTSANRAAALTHRLLAFSRRQPLNPEPVKANQLVASMEDLLRRTLGERIESELVLDAGLWPTLCDANQLENAVLNLCINARDAMPDGGKLTIETANAHLDGLYAASVSDVRPGDYVCISVTDTGTGMSEDTISKAFDPFFTTKPLGQGTGLGLSMIYGFARQSEGHAVIHSQLGRGTTVRLYLPRHRGAEDVAEGGAAAAEVNQAEEGETVLVIEDDPVVRGLVVELLGELRYRVIEAKDGPSGLAILQAAGRIDLLITDIGLPGLNGRQVADGARGKRPDLKVLFMTGYAENATLANGFLDYGMEMITKPFPMDVLAQRLTTIMGR